MTIKAIETRYKGYRFRSRLEARWAVFFDALGLKWEYEKEGYNLPSGPYLPDFWLTDLRCWAEIKGKKPTRNEEKLAAELADHTHANVFIFPGTLPGYDPLAVDKHETVQAFLMHGEVDEDGEPCASWDNFYAFCICNNCLAIGIEFQGRSDRMRCKAYYTCAATRNGEDTTNFPKCSSPTLCAKKCPRSWHGDKNYTPDHPKILDAICTALSARFENGECG